MNTPKHTPGPWRVRNHDNHGIWVDAPNGMVENDRGPSYARQILEDEDYPEKLADATLIAAAPELLAVAKELLEAIDTHFGIDPSTAPKPVTLRWRVVAAIAKAEGGDA